MKDNCKNRGLKFIRFKNKLRIGKQIYSSRFRYSNLLDEDTIKIGLEYLVKKTKEDLFKEFKLVLNTVVLRFVQSPNDFIQNSTTVICDLSLK